LGTLRITRGNGKTETLISEQTGVKLKPGKNVIGFTSTLDRSGVFTTRAEFVPDDNRADLIQQNNVASTFTRVRGKGKVLLIEDAYEASEFNHLIDRLAVNSIEVDVMKSDDLYTNAAQLLEYDAVVLGNLPRASGDEGAESAISGFSDAQVKMLVDNCEQMGVSAVGALAMVMHACEMPRGNFWQVKIGEAALESLGPMDYCGVVDWNHMGGGTGVRWIC